MDKIDLTTSHNIVVTVELANTTQRGLATCIDGFIMGIYAMVIGLVSSGTSTLFMLLGMPVFLCYHLIFEYFNNGQSIGKRMLKLKVVSLDGERPSLLDLIMRWMFRTIDITVSLGMLAAVFISSTKKKQRLGDILANTAVVRLENESFVSLSSIENMSDDNYVVKYPQVARYKDSDMLLVKQAIKRYQKRPTTENSKIISELYKRISKELKLSQSHHRDKIGFLRNLLNDYVVLTR